MKQNKGISIVILIIVIAIIIGIAGVVITKITGDDGVISNTIKMDIEAVEGEIRDRFKSLLNIEKISASADIAGKNEDIGTRYNEINLIRFLITGKPNYEGENAEKEAVACIEEYTPAKGEESVRAIIPKAGGEASDIQLKNIYRVISNKLCQDGSRYGVGKTITEGDIFTLEAITEPQKNEDGTETGELLSTGKFELKYYDKDGKSEVIQEVELYLTNQS